MDERSDRRLVDQAISRRNMLKAVSAGSGVAAMSFAGLFGPEVANAQGQGEGGDIPTILNLAATAESFAITHFFYGITGSGWFGRLPAVYQGYLRGALTAEVMHYQFLLANGAQPLATKFYVPNGYLQNLGLYVAATDYAESGFIGAYLAAIRRFAELDQPLLAEVAAQVMGVEAEHRTLNRAMGIVVVGNSGIPNDIPLEKPTVRYVPQVVPIFAPFLTGQGQFLGNSLVGPFDMPALDRAMAVGAQLNAVPTAITAYTLK